MHGFYASNCFFGCVSWVFTFWFKWPEMRLLKEKIDWIAFRCFLNSNAHPFPKGNNYSGLLNETSQFPRVICLFFVMQGNKSKTGKHTGTHPPKLSFIKWLGKIVNITVLTKTRNNLTPLETMWNHLKPLRNYLKPVIL